MSEKVLIKPALYIDIDGVLLANESNLSEGAADFIRYAADNFEVYWLTTHCMHGDPKWAVEYVNRASDEDLSPWLEKFKPTTWSLAKTDAIDMTKPFLWFDDDCLYGERNALAEAGVPDSWVNVDLYKKQDQMVWELITLRSLNEYDKPLPKNIYEYMENGGLILLAGQTGSGKSVLVKSYLNYMAGKYSTDEWGAIALDVVAVDYGSEKDNPYLIELSNNIKNDSAMELLKRIAFLSVDRTMKKKDNQPKLITVHVNECDMAMEDIGYFLDYLNKIGTSNVMESGIQVIYETSRIGEETIPPELLKIADLRLLQPVANTETAEYFTGRKNLMTNKVGETITLNRHFHKYLVNKFPPVKFPDDSGPFEQ